MKHRKLIMSLPIVLIVLIGGCSKQSDEITPNNEIENVEAAEAMMDALHHLNLYNDSLMNHGGNLSNHYDAMYHHHDSLYLHHHATYHHGDTTHHHSGGLHNTSQHHQHDSINNIHHSFPH